MPRPRHKKSKKDDVIPRWDVHYPPLPWAGHDTRRPLSVVLKALAGDDSGLCQGHLSVKYDLEYLITDRELYDERDRLLADISSIKIAEASMIAMMRDLADLWIDSGKSGQDKSIDNPTRRNVEYSTPRRFSISNTYSQLLGGGRRRYEMCSDGTQRRQEPAFGFDATSLRGFKTEGFKTEKQAMALNSFGQKIAIYWFAKLLDSKFSRHLARCDDCGVYFGYERAPLREIKNGIHCPSCKGSGSARRMKSSRDSLTNDMVTFAAAIFADWKKSRQDPDQRVWVAKQVSERFEKKLKAPITIKWVSQNKEAIEAEIERRKLTVRTIETPFRDS